ncbi:MAG: 16S rRNA (guanine(527)-N(7))-methyltransferase RsmG, partial [Sphaerospermopsis kisseleviana]
MSLESVFSLPEMVEVWQETLNWQPTNDQQNQLQKLYELVIEANRYVNLTRITEASEFWEKHLWDSLRGVAPKQHFIDSLHPGASVIDIGTGAGFPGLPIAIIFPNSQ